MKPVLFSRLGTLSVILLCTTLHAQSYTAAHKKAILVDTHNDILSTAIEKGYSLDQNLKGKTHSDLQRMKAGGVDARFFLFGAMKTKNILFNLQTVRLTL